ncbi:hypothetical protein GCM10022198_02300 [Klugiella xanthotipulae]|uniref:histidine kinase n=1 Tax=Klugiella xanthotipulae TaxID=244735 RepID=A0A543I4Z4_9MICO|nr:HAMP domain-containing sensor histidine kinase [Klugiella xanthotipulae]TQM65634.1 two-component system OmpR family sensor kinase [Klugiella xanthotipulae]
MFHVWESVSLRTKITGVTVLILTFGIFIVGAGTMMILRPQLVSQQDSTLRQLSADPTPILATGANATGLTRNDVLMAPRDTYYVGVLDENGVLLYDNFHNSTSHDVPQIPQVSVETANELGNEILPLTQVERNVSWRGVLSPIVSRDSTTGNLTPSGTLVIALSMDSIDNLMLRYITIFSGFGLVVVVLGAILTRLLVTSTFEPLREVENTAAAIADGDFSQRVPITAAHTEVGRLGRSLNTMLRRIDLALADRAATIEQMRRFVGDASHELRTPLVSVRGYAELYRMGALQTPADVAQAMERIEKEAVRMGTLVEDLLALARLDEAKPVDAAPIDLIPLAQDAALDAMASSPDRQVRVILGRSTAPNAPLVGSSLAATLSATGATGNEMPSVGEKEAMVATGNIPFASATLARLKQMRMRRSSLLDTQPLTRIELAQLSAEGPDSERPDTPTPSPHLPQASAMVLGDENKIRQVMTNLLGNARRYTASGDPIEIAVSTDPDAGTATFEIVDHGEGIPEQIREKIFQRFWRADTSRNRDTGGSGLGLAIVSSIVAAHNGTVSAHETPGGGATFRVTLPLYHSPAAESETTA